MRLAHDRNARRAIVRSQHLAHLGRNSRAETLWTGAEKQTGNADMATMNTTAAADFGLIARVRSLAEAMAEARGRRRVYDETRRELGGLSNRDLADLGIDRVMIAQIAHEAAYGK